MYEYYVMLFEGDVGGRKMGRMDVGGRKMGRMEVVQPKFLKKNAGLIRDFLINGVVAYKMSEEDVVLYRNSGGFYVPPRKGFELNVAEHIEEMATILGIKIESNERLYDKGSYPRCAEKGILKDVNLLVCAVKYNEVEENKKINKKRFLYEIEIKDDVVDKDSFMRIKKFADFYINAEGAYQNHKGNEIIEYGYYLDEVKKSDLFMESFNSNGLIKNNFFECWESQLENVMVNIKEISDNLTRKLICVNVGYQLRARDKTMSRPIYKAGESYNVVSVDKAYFYIKAGRDVVRINKDSKELKSRALVASTNFAAQRVISHTEAKVKFKEYEISDKIKDKEQIFCKIKNWAANNPMLIRCWVYGSFVKNESKVPNDIDIAVEVVPRAGDESPLPCWFDNKYRWTEDLSALTKSYPSHVELYSEGDTPIVCAAVKDHGVLLYDESE